MVIVFFVAVVVFVPEPFRLKSILAPVAAEELGKINSVTQDKIHHQTNRPARAQSRYAVHFPSIGRAEPHTVDNDDDTESASCHESLRIVLWKIEINLATRATLHSQFAYESSDSAARYRYWSHNSWPVCFTTVPASHTFERKDNFPPTLQA